MLYQGRTSFGELGFCAGKTEVPQEKRHSRQHETQQTRAPHWNQTHTILVRGEWWGGGWEVSALTTAPSLPLQSTLSQSKAYLTLTLVKRYFGSNFFAKSMESYIRAKPVLLPPPKAVLKPKQKITSAVVLYTLANFSRISAFETFGLPGWRTSTTYEEKNVSDFRWRETPWKLFKESCRMNVSNHKKWLP